MSPREPDADGFWKGDGVILGHRRLAILDLDARSNQPMFSADGRYLYGTSYYTGVSNVFRYDFQTKKMEAVSNVETGLFRPIPISDRELIAYHYAAKGFAPMRSRKSECSRAGRRVVSLFQARMS